jgi:predicted nucleotide-binding protein (sugar kinase/HSP70/actin superfamily)
MKEAVQPGDLLHVKNPELIFTSLDFKNKMYHYNCVKVASLNDVLHNSQPMLAVQAQNQVVSNNFV